MKQLANRIRDRTVTLVEYLHEHLERCKLCQRGGLHLCMSGQAAKYFTAQCYRVRLPNYAKNEQRTGHA